MLDLARNIFRRLFSVTSKANQESAWPILPVTLPTVPKFLFILTPPCSGSTLLAKVLNTAHRSVLLHPKAEGLWLIPGTKSLERWNPDFKFNWESVRSVWLNKIEHLQSLVGTIDLVVEKSPILSVRSSELKSNFPDDYFLVLNRNPYASCSSFFHRYNDTSKATEARQLAWLTKSDRRAIQNELAPHGDLLDYFGYSEN